MARERNSDTNDPGGQTSHLGFNMSDCGGDRLCDDIRWGFGVPLVGNANFAWVQRSIHQFAPTGTAGFVLADGSMPFNQCGECEIEHPSLRGKPAKSFQTHAPHL